MGVRLNWGDEHGRQPTHPVVLVVVLVVLLAVLLFVWEPEPAKPAPTVPPSGVGVEGPPIHRDHKVGTPIRADRVECSLTH